MTQALDKGTLDIAVLSTDGAIAEIAQGANFKIVSPFVTSPLRYGVYVWARQREIQTVEDLEGRVFAVSRKGSLSHVMTYLHSQHQSWNPRNWDRTGLSLSPPHMRAHTDTSSPSRASSHCIHINTSALAPSHLALSAVQVQSSCSFENLDIMHAHQSNTHTHNFNCIQDRRWSKWAISQVP
jgi:hypothetical protein